MQNLIKNFKILLLSTTIFLCFPFNCLAIEDAIIAVVNDEVITLKNLKDYIHATYVELSAAKISPAQLKEIMLDLETNGIHKLIEDRLILSKANEIGLKINNKMIASRIKEIKERYDSEEVFLNALIENGATVSDLKNKILNQLKIKFVIEHEVKSKIFVNPQEVTKFYEQNILDFHTNERVYLESIYIAFAGNKDAAREKSKTALNLINEGGDFLEISKKYSDIPSIGTLEKGQVLPYIEEIIFNMEEDVPSPIIEVETGFYIFNLKGKTPSKLATLKEVKKNIYDILYQKKFQEGFLAWLEKLKKEAYIEIKK